MKNFISFIKEVVKTVALAALIVLPIRIFLFQPFLVRGSSMEPNYYQGDYLIVDQISYRFREPERGEVIVFNSPHPPQRRYIKRIVGMPGERITLEDGVIYVENGEKSPLDEADYLSGETPGEFETILGEGEYFVLGDNREASLDSRNWGALPKDDIIGKVGIQVSTFTTLADSGIPRIIR